MKRLWYPTGKDWHDSVSNSLNSSANLMGANSWFTMKWTLHPERGSFRTCSTSCTSTIIECKEQESTSRKRKRIQTEKTEEEKEKMKKAKMKKAHEQKENRQKALEKMKDELGSRESLQVPIKDPEEQRKIERKEELRKKRELKKATSKKEDAKKEPVVKEKRDPLKTVTKCFSVRIKPTRDQKQIINHWIGCARFTYNQGLAIVKKYTSKDEKPTINGSLFQSIKGQLVPYDKVDRDKPWLHNCPEKIRAYAVHQELSRTYDSNFKKGVKNFDPRFRNKEGAQSIHIPKDKIWYSRDSTTIRIFPNHGMKTEHFTNLSDDVMKSSKIKLGDFRIFGTRFNSRSTTTSKKRSKKKMNLVERCFKEDPSKVFTTSKFDVTFVRTATKKYEIRLTYDEPVIDVQERNYEKQPEKKFDSVFIDPGNRTFSTMYSPEGFSCSVGDRDISRIFRLLKTHDKLQSGFAKKNNKHTRNKKEHPNSMNGKSKIHLAVLREKIKNLRDEVHWQTISFLLKNFKNIFIPKLDTKSMIMKGSRNLNKKAVRQMLTWSHSVFIQRLIGKAQEFKDTHVHVVDECYTSKTCGSCGVINESLGSSKWFSCKRCGFKCERDLNGARNIFIKTVCENVLNISEP